MKYTKKMIRQWKIQERKYLRLLSSITTSSVAKDWTHYGDICDCMFCKLTYAKGDSDYNCKRCIFGPKIYGCTQIGGYTDFHEEITEYAFYGSLISSHVKELASKRLRVLRMRVKCNLKKTGQLEELNNV